MLDLGLPGLDGLDVLRRVRRDSGIPVLVLTGRKEELSKLDGFAAGADDYVVKPFSLAEVGARVQALLRRGRPLPTPERFEHGGLVVDAAAGEVTVDGEPVPLRPKELTLLAFFAASPGPRVLPRRAARARVGVDRVVAGRGDGDRARATGPAPPRRLRR